MSHRLSLLEGDFGVVIFLQTAAGKHVLRNLIGGLRSPDNSFPGGRGFAGGIGATGRGLQRRKLARSENDETGRPHHSVQEVDRCR